MKPVSAATEQALRAALGRLMAGAPVRCDGRLTVANLAREADVSRATANRAVAVLVDLRQAAAQGLAERCEADRTRQSSS